MAVRLGVATGKDLAQAYRDYFSPSVSFILWMCEMAIAACDLAELLGSAIALQLLFSLPQIMFSLTYSIVWHRYHNALHKTLTKEDI